MKITLSKTITQEVNVPVPSFWKSPTTAFSEYVALLDDNTAAQIILLTDCSIIKNGTPEKMASEISHAHLNFNLCTEGEFLSAYDEALQGMSLEPKGVVMYSHELND